MKKVLAIVLVMCLCVAMIGCTQNTPKPTATTAPSAAAPSEQTTTAASSAASSQKTVIKIGVLAPLSGSVASQGKELKAGCDAALEYFNKNGGFKNLKNVEVQLDYADSQSNPDVGVSQFTKLVTVDNVTVVLGAYQSGVTSPCATVAIQNQVPLVDINAVANTVISQNSNYVFRPSLGDCSEQPQHLDFWKAVNDVYPIKTMAFIGSADDYGNSALAMYQWVADSLGAKMALKEQVQSGVADLSGFVQKVKQANPDVLVVALQLNEALLLQKTLHEYNCNVPVMAKGAGYMDPTFLSSVGGNAEGVISSSGWLSDTLQYLSPDAATWSKREQELSGLAPNEVSSNAWMCLGITLQAMDTFSDVKGLTRQTLADAIDKTNFGPDNWANMFFQHPKIAFEDKQLDPNGTVKAVYNQNFDAKLQFGQIQNGKWVLVYPFTLAGNLGQGNKIVLPKK